MTISKELLDELLSGVERFTNTATFWPRPPSVCTMS